MTLRTILVPVRGDGKGEGVLDHALSLAKRYNAHLEVLHCRQQPGDMIYGVMVPEGLRETIRASANAAADEEEAKVRKLFEDYCAKRDIAVVEKSPGPGGSVSARWREANGQQAEARGLGRRPGERIVVARPDRDRNRGVHTLP